MRKKILDISKCIGCKNCELACIAAHSEGGTAASAFSAGVTESQRQRNKVEHDKYGNLFPQFCRHCDEPACVEACQSGALKKNEDGTVICDKEICVGCYMCVMACPYGMARPSANSDKIMVKCDLCVGKDFMACVDVCPTGCLKSAEGDEAIEIICGE